MLNISPQELLLILLVALLVVGPRRLPELGRSLGKGLRELRKAQDEVRKTIQVNLEEERPTHPRAGPTPPGDAQPDGGASGTAGGSPAVSGSAAAAAGAASIGGGSSEAASSGAKDVSEVSRSLGRGIAELRRARKEIQRTFRVDLDEPRSSRPAAPATPRRPPSKPTPTPESGDAGTTDEAGGASDVAAGEPVTGSQPE